MPREKTGEFQAQLEALRRAQILDAAARVFARAGFRAARVQDVAAEAGIANGTVYNYFPTKDALLIGLLDRLNETESRPAQLASIDPTDPRAALAAVIRHRLDVLAADEGVLRVLLSEILVDPALRERYLREVVAPAVRLGEANVEGRLGPERAALVSRAMGAAVFGVVMFRLLDEPGTRVHADALAELLAEVFTPVLAATAAPRSKP